MSGQSGPVERAFWALIAVLALGAVLLQLIGPPMGGSGVEHVYQQAVVIGVSNGFAFQAIRRGGPIGSFVAEVTVAITFLLIATLVYAALTLHLFG